ncbi:BolA family transcriptional regulator [Amylibacter marinus]|uniref:BolA family transcriptional regulator n=1 Tax=Amylibacter marinus TaxID=1475483 RepID=A0ABQ5VUC0_9RHOB|nr:BolA family protein [Amylibacter marinus]GLQ34852.1 BolA family transcriptional regulator [Amylibacter marinus]
MLTAIETALQQTFDPTELEVVDDSESHRGHGGYREGETTHVNVKIRAEYFSDLSRVARQRAVNKALDFAFDQGLHALALDVDGA